MAAPEIDILLVEDDESEAHRISVMLKQAEDVRFQIGYAVSLKAALMVIGIKRPSIVLLDLSLEDYQGYDTVVEFSKNVDVPFIVLTGNDDMTMAMRSVSLGAQDYILKNDVKAKPLERTILMCLKRAANQAVTRELESQSRTMVFDDDEKATVSLLRPQVSQLIETLEDLENYVRKNAPNLMSDVRSIMDKHSSDVTIKALRDTMRLHADRSSRPGISRHPITDQALRAVDSVIEKRGRPRSETPPVSEADRDLLEIIHRHEDIGES